MEIKAWFPKPWCYLWRSLAPEFLDSGLVSLSRLKYWSMPWSHNSADYCNTILPGVQNELHHNSKIIHSAAAGRCCIQQSNDRRGTCSWYLKKVGLGALGRRFSDGCLCIFNSRDTDVSVSTLAQKLPVRTSVDEGWYPWWQRIKISECVHFVCF